MIMNEEFSELFRSLSKLMIDEGFSFSTMNLSVRIMNPEAEHLSITWNRSGSPAMEVEAAAMESMQLAESILKIVEDHISDSSECGLILVSDRNLPNIPILKHFNRVSKNCLRYIVRIRGKRVFIQLLGRFDYNAIVE